MAKIYAATVGTEIKLDTGISLDGATGTCFKVLKPDDIEVSWPASVVDVTFLKHLVTTDEIKIPGIYKIQAYAKIGSWEGRGETFILEVKASYA